MAWLGLATLFDYRYLPYVYICASDTVLTGILKIYVIDVFFFFFFLGTLDCFEGKGGGEVYVSNVRYVQYMFEGKLLNFRE